MFRPRVIPCLLLKDEGLVKTIQFRNPVYVGDPMNAIKIFNDKEADELIFVDITASKEQRCIRPSLVKKISHEAYMPVAVGGGIKTLAQLSHLMESGVEKVIINTAAFLTPKLITDGANKYGSQSIVVAIDIKKEIFGKYYVWIMDGSKRTDKTPVEYAQYAEAQGAGEIFVNSIDKDGTMTGFDIDSIRKISDAVSIPVIACGGAGLLSHISDVIRFGHASAAAAGSLFVFYGRKRAVLINYPERKELLECIGCG